MTSIADALSGTGTIPAINASDLDKGSPGGVKSLPTSAMMQNTVDQARVESAAAERDAAAKNKPKLPELDPEPKQEEDNPIKGYVSTIGLLGALSSAFARTHVTGAMNAASGVLTAMKNRDEKDLKDKYEVWKIKNANALKMFDYQNDTYKDILNTKNKSVDECISELKANAAAFKDDNMMQLLTARNPAIIEDLLAKADAARTSAEKNLVKVQEGYDNYQAFLKGKEGLDADLSAGKISKMDYAKKLQSLITPPKSGASSGSMLTQEATKLSATLLLTTGNMPNLGIGSKEDKEAVVNEAAKMAKEQGMSYEDVAAGRATYKADSSALTQLTKNANVIEGFERTAKLNMENALRLMDKGAGSEKGPVINRWLQAGRKATGDPDVKAFDAALFTATIEYAKVMSGALSTAALTDSARQEAEDKIISSIDSPSAVQAVYKEVMVPDMQNRTTGYTEQIATLKKSLGSSGGKKVTNNAEEPPHPGAKKAPDGNWYVPDPQKPGGYLKVEQ